MAAAQGQSAPQLRRSRPDFRAKPILPMTPHLAPKLAVSLALAAAPFPAFSQAVPAAAPTSAETAPSDQVVKLDPFTVDSTRDVGYVAVDSLAGGRANLPLRVTAAPIFSLTRAFIDDVQMTNIRDALRWTAGAVPQNWRGGRTGSGGQFNSWAFSVRGQGDLDQGGNPPSRNYFPNYVVQDLYNVDRVEAARGPNSILFGVGDIGGSIATYTKVPRVDRSFNDTVFTFNDRGGVRATDDYNRVVNKRLAVRVNTLLERERGWRDGDKAGTFAADLSFLYNFSDNTRLRVELEGYDRKNSLYTFTIKDTNSLWDRNTDAPTWGSTIAGADKDPLKNPGAPGVKPMTAWGPTTLVWIPGIGLMDWHDGYRSMGPADVGFDAYLQPNAYDFGPTGTTIPALPHKSFTVAPGDSYLRARYASITAILDQKINPNMELQLSAYGYLDAQRTNNGENVGADGATSSVDLNRQLPNGQPNPNYGKLYSDVFLMQQNQYHPAREFRGQFNYHFDTTVFGVPLKQWFSVSGGYRRTELKPRTYLAFDKVGITADDWIQHMIWGRMYWDKSLTYMNLPRNADGRTLTYQAMPFNWFDFDLRETIKYAGIVSQSRLWNDRLNLTLGARRDKYSNYKIGIRGLSNTATSVDESGTTLQGGVIAYVTSWLGINYNYSENFAPLAGGVAPSLYGQALGASKGKGQTMGLRVSTADGKYYASANYYRDKSTGRPRGGPGFQGIWNDYLDAGGTATDIGPSGVITGSGPSANASMSFSDTTDLESHGYEFEFVGNPTPNLRLQANYSIPKSELSNSVPDSRRYYAEHLAEWQAVATTPSSDPAIQAKRDSLRTNLENVQREITSLSQPVVNSHLIKSTFSFFGTYTFPQDILKGYSVGAGVTYLGKQYGNTQDVVNGERILSPGYSVYNLMVAYNTTFRARNREVRMKIQLNVDNLLGNDTLIYRSYKAYGTGLSQGLDYDFIEPRKWTLSTSFSF